MKCMSAKVNSHIWRNSRSGVYKRHNFLIYSVKFIITISSEFHYDTPILWYPNRCVVNINLAMNEESSERSRLLPESSTFQSNGNICGQCDVWIDSVVVGRSSEDDVVSLGLKRLCVAFSVVIIFWLISFIFIMMTVLFKWSITTWDLVLFLPMWIGTCTGIASTIYVSRHVCNNTTIVSPERRNYMRQQGTDECALFVDCDSLPLMRRLLCWNIGLCLAFMLVLVAQVLFSLWAIYGIIGLWHALIPVCLLIVGYLLYLFSMRVVSLSTCGFVALAVGQLVRTYHLPFLHAFVNLLLLP